MRKGAASEPKHNQCHQAACCRIGPLGRSDKIGSMVKGFEQGQHICAVYETPAEQIATAAEYLADGLRAGERVFYVADSRSGLARFRAALRRLGIDTEGEIQRAALIQKIHSEAHLIDGRFESERMMHPAQRASRIGAE
jgi:hypothetical protein